ncbi:YccF domain-containing protein [Butyrivibrio sp. AD3002]|uniref:YccF domain-containing protein n=1 Tax=Butyrivibrio sp. AD3002 TaxID=1280670 RepID=UPI0003B3665E|nr:YccF domain-containing protein [Butyrivibrio sp. AD3002]
MRFIGNVIWFVFGGLLSAIAWWITGLLWCITVVGIPVGIQCFKLSSISLNPFGKEIENEGGTVSFLLNVLWLLISGWELALGNAIIGCLFCITIVGIPFGKQFFKIAKVALMPFGAKVVRKHYL